MSKAAVCTVLAAALLCLGSASPAFASSTSPFSLAPSGIDASFIQLGGFLKLLGGFLGIGVASSTSSGGSSGGSNGFTQVYVLLDGGGSVPNTQTPTDQQGTSYNGSGSRVIYISETAGSDSNPCTLAEPCQSLAHGASLMRPGYPDQLLLDCTDSTQARAWPATDGFNNGNAMPNGFGGTTVRGQVGGVITGPALISFYSPSGGTCTTRPMLLQSSTGNNQIALPFTRSGATYGSIAIIGLNFYAYTRDPTNAAYSITDAEDGTWAIQTGFGTGTSISWTLIEDNKCSYQNACVELQGLSADEAGTVYVRRNIIVHSYSPGAYNLTGGHSQCTYTTYASSAVFDENFFSFCGWDPTLTAAQSVTVSGNTITWPIANYAFDALPFPNNATVFFQSNCGSATAETAYNVINVSGATLQVSATEGGSAVSLSGCSTATMMWADPISTIFNHALYADQLNGPHTLTFNIVAFSNDLMNRPGPTATGNFLTYDENSLSFGAFEGCCGGGEPTIGTVNATENIIQHAAGASGSAGHSTTGGQFSDSGDVTGVGIQLNNANGADGSGINISNNLLSLFGSTSGEGTFLSLSVANSGDVSNATISSNIGVLGGNCVGTDCLDAGINAVGDSNNNITASWTCLDVAGTGCATNYPAPSTTDILSYDHATWGTTCSNSSPGNWAYDNTCWQDFESREENRQLQTWPENLSACAINQYIESVGFGLTYNCTEN